MRQPEREDLQALDRRIVLATQSGLPLNARPYDALAAQLGADPELVKQRLRSMLSDGRIRRIAAVPNHYRLGYLANGMSVWDVRDERIAELGPQVGALGFVSHCYHRPRHPPHWPYNLFAMVHARDLDAVMAHVAEIAGLLGGSCRAHEVLFSTRILKKTGLRLHRERAPAPARRARDPATET